MADILSAEYVETYYEAQCPYCYAWNWVCDGDTSDSTLVDIEAIQCWKCDKKFWMYDSEDVGDIKDAACEMGRRQPT